MWDLSSPTRDQSRIPCIRRWIQNHWTTREVLSSHSLFAHSACILLCSHFELGILGPWGHSREPDRRNPCSHEASPVMETNINTAATYMGLPKCLSGKDSTCWYRRYVFDPWVVKVTWRRKWQPTPLFLPEKSHGQRSPEGYSPWGHKESDTTEWVLMQATYTWCKGHSSKLEWKVFWEKWKELVRGWS